MSFIGNCIGGPTVKSQKASFDEAEKLIFDDEPQQEISGSLK